MGQDFQDDASIPAHFMEQLYRSCQALGARKPVLLAASGLDEARLRDPRARFSRAMVASLYQATARELGSAHIFPDLGREMVPAGFSDNGYAALFRDTVGNVLLESLNRLGLHNAPNANFPTGRRGAGCAASRSWLRLERSGRSSRLVWQPPQVSGNELANLLFSMVSCIGQAVLGTRRTAIKAVHFCYKEPEGFGDFVRFGDHPVAVPCVFSQNQTYLELHNDVLDLPNPRFNPSVTMAREAQFDRFVPSVMPPSGWAAMCYEYLLYRLNKTGFGLDAAAATFGTAERTLRRKLAAERTSFRAILEQVRRDTCQLYFLEGSRSLSQIATELGYSELSAFTRAYGAWHGHPPSRDLAAHTILAA